MKKRLYSFYSAIMFATGDHKEVPEQEEIHNKSKRVVTQTEIRLRVNCESQGKFNVTEGNTREGDYEEGNLFPYTSPSSYRPHHDSSRRAQHVSF